MKINKSPAFIVVEHRKNYLLERVRTVHKQGDVTIVGVAAATSAAAIAAAPAENNFGGVKDYS